MKLALIGGGMVGRCYGQAFAAQGLTLCGIWDAAPTDDLRAFAQQHGIPLHTDAGTWLGQADAVLSAVFGAAALEVATAALPHLRPHPHTRRLPQLRPAPQPARRLRGRRELHLSVGRLHCAL